MTPSDVATAPPPAEATDALRLLGPAQPELEQLAIRTVNWPTRLIASLALLGLVAAAFDLPAATRGVVPALIMALPALIAAVVTRLLFESTSLSSRRVQRVLGALAATGAGTALIAACALVVGQPLEPATAALSVPLACSVLLLAVGLRRVELRLGARNRRIFFIGSPSARMDLAHEIRRRGDISLVGFMETDFAAVRAELEPLVRGVLEARPTTLVMSSDAIRDEHFVAVASQLNMAGLRIRSLSDFYEREFTKIPLNELTHEWFLFDVAEIHRTRVYGVARRLIEILCSAGLLLVTVPIFPLVALAIKLTSAGPVFYRQTRVGTAGHHFQVTKFRTMTHEEVPLEAAWATEHAMRITPLGAVLRRYRIDELPQLWNILSGRLSLVGPRPEQPAIVERLQGAMEFYGARHRVRPGVTGWAQINQDYPGTVQGSLEKLQYDFYYIKNQGLRLDLLILGSTIKTILAGRGR